MKHAEYYQEVESVMQDLLAAERKPVALENSSFDFGHTAVACPAAVAASADSDSISVALDESFAPMFVDQKPDFAAVINVEQKHLDLRPVLGDFDQSDSASELAC
jgi:hypothetical protein